MKRKMHSGKLRLGATALLFSLLFSSCGGARQTAYKDYSSFETADKSVSGLGASGPATEETSELSKSAEVNEGYEASPDSSGYVENEVPNNPVEATEANVNPAEISEKKIRTVNMSLECKSMESAAKELKDKVKAQGGYIESEDYSAISQWNDTKRMNFTIRLPKGNVDSFLDFLNGEGRILSKSENLQDVRLQYRDAKNHIKALETEQERILALMEKAETVDQLIALENRLTEIRYQLDSYNSEILDYDNKVDFSTIYLELQESIDGKINQSGNYGFFDRVRDGFIRNLFEIRLFFSDLALFVLVFIPQILLVLLAIIAIVFANKKLLNRKKKEKKPEQNKVEQNKAEQEKKEQEKKEESPITEEFLQKEKKQE